MSHNEYSTLNPISNTNFAPQNGRNYDEFFREKMVGNFWEFLLLAFLVTTVAIHSSAPTTFIIKLLHGNEAGWLGLVWYIGGFMGVIIALSSPAKTFKALIYAWPFIVFNIYAWFSTTWSVSPSDTIKGSFLLSMSQLGAVGIAARYSWFQIVRYIAYTLTVIIAVSVFLAMFVPSLGRMKEVYPGAWSGLFAEKQAIGFYSVMQIIFTTVLGVYFPRFRIWIFAGIFGLMAIIGSQSKTAIIMVIVAYIAIFGSKLLQNDRRLMLITIFGAVLSMILVGIGHAAAPDLIFKLLGKSKDLTGRTEIWEAIDFLAQQRPTFGWGYRSIWKGMQDPASPYQWIANMTDFTPSNAHSSFKEAELALGKVGLWMLYFMLAKMFFDMLFAVRRNHLGSGLGLAVLLSLLTISSTEAVLLGSLELYWLLLVTLAVKVQIKEPEILPPSIPTNRANFSSRIYTYPAV